MPSLREVARTVLNRFSCVRMDVDELVSEFYLKSFAQLGTQHFKTSQHLISAAYKRMYWFVLDTLRSRQRIVPGTHTLSEEASNETGVQTHVEKDDLIEVVWSALDTLPEDLRTIVQRRLTDELSYAQIAAELNIGSATAHERFQKAMKKLRAIVDSADQR
jgi:RNA polymerase sigma factor (sigma-70 family)